MTVHTFNCEPNTPKSIIKRDGSAAVFDTDRIRKAVLKAGLATGEFSDEVANRITSQISIVISHSNESESIHLERIQDIVEQALISAGYTKTARAYISYRDQHKRLRESTASLIDAELSINEYLDMSDWRVNANANQGYSLGGLILNASGKLTANYWLNYVYSPEIGEAHRSGDIHIHDLDLLAPYCAGWSLRTFLEEGLNGVPGKVEASPPKHLSSAVGQIVNFLGTLQNEWAGAQAFSSFDTYMAPLIRKDSLTYGEVKQNIQELVYNLNVPSRWGCVDEETEVLSTTGWKKHNELKQGDSIYTWKEGMVNINKVNKVVINKHTGILHSYRGKNYDQTVTPEHRVLTYDHNIRKERIRISSSIFNSKTPYALPAKMNPGEIGRSELSDDEIILAAMIYADGNIDIRNDSVHKVKYFKSLNRWGASFFEEICASLGLEYHKKVISSWIGKEDGYPEYNMNQYTLYGDSARTVASLVGAKDRIHSEFTQLDARQSLLFLDAWARHDGEAKKGLLQCDNADIANTLQHIALRSGQTSYIKTIKTTRYVKLRKPVSVIPTSRVEIDYDGLVWCPSVEDGTAVFRKNGSVFISGQTQTPFSNLTFDWVCPDDVKYHVPAVGGEPMPFCYGDLQEEMNMINRAYIEVMTEGDAKGRVFTFPIPTYNITKDFPWDDENTERLFAMTAKYGLPYFQNFINSDLSPGMVRSMCCRLQLDLRELLKRGNGLFGSAEQTGSLGVVTINCARLGFLNKGNIDGLFKSTDALLNLAKTSLEIKRKVIQKHMDNGLFPYTKRYLGTLRNHFSTIGVNGINEMIRNFTDDDHDITSPYGMSIAYSLLSHIRDKMVEFQEETGKMYNLEATPAEGTTYRFAREDKKRYEGILQAGTEECPYYTNSSQLPVGYTDDPFTALSHQEPLQRMYTGGTVLHLYMSERISSTEACKNLVKRSLEMFGLPYITVTPTFSICPIHGYISGEHEFCPICDDILIEKQAR